jgi:hypothetical protein
VEIRTVHLDDVAAAPFSGNGLVVVLEISEDSVSLMHPHTFEQWTMPAHNQYSEKNGQPVLLREGYAESCKRGEQLWPTNQSDTSFAPKKFAANVLERAKLFAKEGKQFSTKNVARLLAALTGEPSEKIIGQIGEIKEASMATKKKGSSKKKKTTGEKKAPRAGRIYRLAAATTLDKVKEGSHKFAVIKALQELKEGTTAQVVEVAEKGKFIKGSKMKADKAIGWMLGQMAKDKSVLFKEA